MNSARPGTLRLALLALAIAIPGFGSAVADEPPTPPEAARWIDADAVAYLEIRDVDRLVDRVADPKLAAFLKRLPNFAAAFESKQFRDLSQAANFLAGSLQTTWERGLADIARGGVVAAVELGPFNIPRFVLIARAESAEALDRTHRAVVDLLRQVAAAEGQPDPVKTVRVGDLDAYQFHPLAAHALVGEHLVVSNGTGNLAIFVNRLRGKSNAKPLAESESWLRARETLRPDALAFARVRLDQVRKLNPKALAFPNDEVNPLVNFLFPDWVELARATEWAAAQFAWNETELAARLALGAPPQGYRQPYDRLVAKPGESAPAPLNPPGAIASLALRRDLATVWEARAELFPPEAVQGLAQLDGLAGTFFGGRDFGTGVLGSLAPDWRLVVANQDHAALKPVPDVKLPAFALVIGLKPGESDFADRLLVAFQSFIGLASLGAAQNKTPPFRLGNETHDGVAIATAAYMAPPPKPKSEETAGEGDEDETVNSRHNFVPNMAVTRDQFILSSGVQLTRDLVDEIRRRADAPAPPRRKRPRRPPTPFLRRSLGRTTRLDPRPQPRNPRLLQHGQRRQRPPRRRARRRIPDRPRPIPPTRRTPRRPDRPRHRFRPPLRPRPRRHRLIPPLPSPTRPPPTAIRPPRRRPP